MWASTDEDLILTELVAYGSDDERNSGELATCEQMLRLVENDSSVHVRPKLRVDRMIERKLQQHRLTAVSLRHGSVVLVIQA